MRLDAAFFTGLPEGPLAADNFVANATGTAETDRHYVLYNTTTGALFFDADGSGSGAAIQFAALDDKPELKHTDFVVAC